VLEALHETPERLSVAKRYALFVNIILRSGQVHKNDVECEDANRAKLEAFREFRYNGIIEKNNKYKKAELSFQGLCHRIKTKSW
jgi:hypothetical protein